MKKQIFHCFLLIVLLGTTGRWPVAAQQYFNKRYTLGTGGNVFTGALQKNNKYYTVNICNDSINYIGGTSFKNVTGIKFSVFDSTGKIISTKLYQRDDKIFTAILPDGITPSNNFRILNDSIFLFAFTVMDTAYAAYSPGSHNFQSAIVEFDSIGNVVMYKEYDRPYCKTTDQTTQLMCDFKPDAYGNWLMLTLIECNAQIVFNLRKLDKNFNEIWDKNFSVSGMQNLPQHLLIEPDGYTMTGGINNANAGLGYVNYYASLIVKCDTAGTMLWHWQNTFDITNLQYTINDIIRTKDSGYIYCGSGRGNPLYAADGSGHWSGIVVWGYVEKLDSNRKLVWQTKLGYVAADPNQNEQTVLKELTNGDIMVAGTLGKFFDDVGPKGNTKAALTKLRGTDGTILWQRLYDYHPDTLSGYIYDMRQTTDGGYILAGYTMDEVVVPFTAPTQRGWLIKVDSNGCEGGASCNPTAIIPVNPTANYINIYPNPSTSDYELQYEVQNKEPLQLVISDITGRILLQTNLPAQQNTYHIHAVNWASGVYIYQLSREGAIFKTGKLIKN
jgi:hypothetical protein